MNIVKSNKFYDVVVVGAGLAGIKAAVTAANKGSSVLVCTKSALCSGSSFYTLMDTLHCQAVIDEADKAVFMQDIADCSYKMNDPVMNQYYIDHINDRITEFPEMGIEYKKLPDPKLACFANHPHSLYFWTDWPKIRIRVKKIFAGTPNITVREKAEAATIVTNKGPGQSKKVKGILLFDKQQSVFEYVACSSVIFATGGFGALYEHNLNSPDVAGDGHVLALEAGAELINLEFNQFIPGFIEPVYKIVFREGTLDYCDKLVDQNGTEILRELLPNPQDYAECLRMRASHGPFTSMDLSKYFDIALMKACLKEQHTDGMEIQYSPEIYNDTRDYVVNYLEWLKNVPRVDLCNTKITIAPFFHAANGGIFVDHHCETKIKGLFACGEAAGGIHGADRLGGNATGSCLVFGYLAAESACAYAKQTKNSYTDISGAELSQLLEDTYSSSVSQSLLPQEIIAAIKKEMWIYANILRTEDGLTQATDRIQQLRKQYNAMAFFGTAEQISAAMQAHRFLVLSEALLAAMKNRKESRGSHFREDYPQTDPAFDHRYKISIQNGAMVCKAE
ncbi:FAD-binding protein [Caproiciproducens sp.]